ncbi:MAG: slipin family protein [Candidatus Altiarchaeota archaeon]|nr:slipin family protein [Candidatus Altiarchaeota archaeon]
MLVGLFFFMIPVLFIGLPFLLAFLSSFIKIVKEYERGILLAFGKYEGVRGPGLNFIIPIYHRLVKMDLRVLTLDVPKQEIMTKDNVPVKINALVYFRIKDPKKAFLEVEDYVYAVSKYGQTSLRNVCGEATLDELLSERKKLAENLRKIVDEATDAWGIDVTMIELMDVELPQDLKRTMARQAEAEREKRATILKAEGEVIASKNLALAADKLYRVPGALHLRSLHSLNDIASDQTNNVTFFVPLEILRALEEVD